MEDAVTPNLSMSLAGRILIAPPGTGDPRFQSSLTLVIEHSAEGAIGLIINRPSLVPMSDVFPDWGEMEASPGMVFAGGPVDHDALIALGRSTESAGSLVLGAHSVDLDSQPTLVAAEGIETIRVFAGYAGWSTGQLEKEIADNCWWIAEASLDDLFTDNPSHLWAQVMCREGGERRWYAHYPNDVHAN